MKMLWILRGLPASGKSTFADDLFIDNDRPIKRANRDDLRSMIDGGQFSSTNEVFIKRVENFIIKKSLEEGFDVVDDNTNLTVERIKELHAIAASVGDVTVNEVVFRTPVDECVSRDSQRTRSVGRDVIIGYAEKFDVGSITDSETVYQSHAVPGKHVISLGLPWATIIDLDGTISMCHSKRKIHDLETCDLDVPNGPVVTAVKALWLSGDELLFVTARDEKYRDQTETFIGKYVTCPSEKYTMSRPDYAPIKHKLFMKKTGDTRDDVDVKREIYELEIKGKYNVRCAFDDRPCVVKMWRHELGITTFQLNDVEF